MKQELLSRISRVRNWEEDGDVFREVVEHLPVIVYVYQYPRTIYANPCCERLYGYSLEEMQQMNFWDFIHPDQREEVKANGTARLLGKPAPSTYELKALRKNGEVLWIDASFIVTKMGRGRKRVAIIGGVDITEKKRLKEELQAAKDELESRVQQRTKDLNRKNQELLILNQKLNNVVRNVSEGVVIVDPSQNIEVLNVLEPSVKSSSELKRILRDYIAGTKDHLIKWVFSKKQSFQEEEMLLATPDGPLSVLSSGTPILNEKGSVEMAVVVLRPIKEVHRLVNRFSGSRAKFRFGDILTKNTSMLDLISKAKLAASSMSSILIEGESGTGKELFAQAIHNESDRRKGPFLAVNCGAIPRELIGSELFGYEEGAFTGAKKRGNPGKFELASGGTLFLDEIADIPLDQQVTLLRAIQEKAITRIGGRREIPVDIRIICATNRNLIDEVRRNNFRHDLFYRLNVINIRIPPLRERADDVELLFNHFLKLEAQRLRRQIKVKDARIPILLSNYSWPGNVRELQNVVERIVNTLQGNILEVEHLPSEILLTNPRLGFPSADRGSQQEYDDLGIEGARNRARQEARRRERNRIIETLDTYGGNMSMAAKALGISRVALYKRMHKDNLKKENR